MLFRQLFDRETSTYTYLVADEETKEALLIDPVIEQVERDITLLRELGLTLRYSLDTHVHADHVTASGTLRSRTSAKTISSVGGAACADLHVKGGDRLELGRLMIEVLATPGHTDDSVSFHIGNNVFTGDALLIRGTGRTDFQNGDPAQLYDSINRVLFALPDDTIVWPGHDYKGNTQSTIGEERRLNPRVANRSLADFVKIMNSLDLPKPAQIDRAVPLNRTCGTAAALNQERPAANVRDIDPGDLSELPAAVHLVDVREPDEWNAELGHLERAELVPLSTVERAQEAWDKKQPILLICRSGRRSLAAAQLLTRRGFEQVMNLRGGMLAVRAQEGAKAS